MVVLPLTFFIFIIKKVLPFFVSFVNPLVFTRWRRPPGCYSATKSTKNLEPWTCHLFSVMVVLPPHFFSYFSFCQSSGLHQVEKTSWSSPGGGRACPKITARCWEIVSVGGVGLNANNFGSKNPWFLVFFPINLVVLCPSLCAISSVDPISSSSIFISPC